MKHPQTHPVLHILSLLVLLSLAALPPAPLPALQAQQAPPAAGPATGSGLTPEQAIRMALNGLQQTPAGYELRHPRHLVTFGPDGFTFTPRDGGPAWAWQMTAVLAREMPLSAVETGPLPPTSPQALQVAYPREGLVEQYLGQEAGIEQQFLLPQPLPLGGADLVIAGTVRSTGTLEQAADGWRWRTGQGEVHLGDVRAHDARGRELPAWMAVTADSTRIQVDGAALADAAYPVTIDPEIGANDFRLSDMGQDNTYDASSPAVAYNSTDNEYLVVWYGDDDDAGTVVDGEYEIYGQRVDAATGVEIGPELRLSDMGSDGDPAYDAYNPAVAYNSADNEYLVVWHGDDNTALLVEGEDEIFGQRVEANTGAEIGSDLRLSDMGPHSDPNYDARVPAVAYNSTANEYLVVWHGDDNTLPLVDEEFEIFGQRVAATGAEIGVDFRISAMGPDGNTSYEAVMPALAYNSTNNEYLVVWHGDDKTPTLMEGELEVFGQRLDAAGNQVGTDDMRLSDMGPNGSPNYAGGFPAVAYNSTAGEYLVVWHGDDNTLPLVDEEFEIFGQRLTGAGAETGTNDFRLSDMGPDGNPAYDAEIADVIYNSRNNEYLVTWYGDDHTGTLVEGEEEIFGQRVDARGGQVGLNDFRLSDMGPDGDPEFGAIAPAAAFSSSAGQYLVVWEGDDNTPPLADNEFEIHGQRLNAATGAALGGDQRISNAGPDGDPAYSMRDCCAAVVYNSTNDEYLVVWASDDNAGGLVNDEFEIFGQLVDAATGAEIGVNDFRISDMGPDGNADYDAVHAAVAYNSTDNEYLVVWAGVDDLAGMVPGEIEIYGQRLDAATGAEVGVNDFPISSMGPVGSAAYGALRPAVAYNSTDNQYLVVWEGQDDTPPLVYGETEIFGQLLYADGGQLGPDDFCLSDMGPESDPAYDAQMPDVVYNSAEGEYLVVWDGDDDTGSLEDNELEVYGQRIEAVTGAQIGLDLRLSDLGPDGDPDYAAWIPAVAYNSDDNEYLVVWWGDDNTPPLVDEEFEIYGQRLDGATAAEIGINDFRLSDMGPDGSPDYAGGYPAVAYNSADHEYLVVWYGDNNVGTLANGEFEVYGQRVDAGTGAEIGGK
jgi:hypothetical protein